jgi:RNA 3'-terminal phosphate cyclase (ATP)
MIEIDGSYGEGGGQILRTALSLSVLLGVPFHIFNVRGNRPRGGLRSQHLAAVRAARAVSGASVEGDELDSRDLRFWPSNLEGGTWRFDLGTAGAIPLVLQTLLPPLIFAREASHLLLTGGTHVPISPPFHFFQHIFLPLLSALDIRASGTVRTYGFYPRGGGEVEAHIWPHNRGPLTPPAFPEKKRVRAIRGVSAVANLPLSIAERQRDSALRVLGKVPMETVIETRSVPSPGRGTFLFLEAEAAICSAGFSSIGVRGKRAEEVGSEAAEALLAYLDTKGCLDPHLSDQIVIYLSLARGRSVFTTTQITPHLVTNLWVIDRFLEVPYTIEGQVGSSGTVALTGVGYSRSS